VIRHPGANVDLGVVDPRRRETRLIRSATDDDVIASVVDGILYAVLAEAHHAYIQCAVREGPPYGYWLSYRDGPDGERLHAQDSAIGLDRVLSAFLKYRRGDPSWKSDFSWGILDEPDVSRGDPADPPAAGR
jgi:hypothetical protein